MYRETGSIIISFLIVIAIILLGITMVKKPSVVNRVPLLSNYTKHLNPTVVIQSPAQQVNSIVTDYYNAYLICVKKQLSNASSSTTPILSQQSCLDTRTGILATDLAKKIGQINGIDPLLCTQNIPPSLMVDKTTMIDNTTASVKIHSVWGESTTPGILVNLMKKNSQWQIASIICSSSQK